MRWRRPVRPKSDGDRYVAWHIQNGKDVEGGGRDVLGDVKEEDPEAIEKDEQENATAGDEVDDEHKLIATSGKYA